MTVPPDDETRPLFPPAQGTSATGATRPLPPQPSAAPPPPVSMTAPEEVALDADGTASVPWTVTNAGSMPVTATAVPAPGEGLDDTWLTVVGGPDRTFFPQSTSIVEVAVRVPSPTSPDAPPDRTFTPPAVLRLDLVPADGSQTVVTGPVVTLTGARRRIPGWLIALLVALLVGVVILVVWLLTREEDEVVAAGDPPTNVAPPTVTGEALVGSELTVAPGTWDGGEPSGYRWQRCLPNDPETCADIEGATATTYAVAEGDVGTSLRVVETAQDPADTAAPTAEQASALTAPVALPEPIASPSPEPVPEPSAEPEPEPEPEPAPTITSVAPPTLQGSFVVGEVVTVDPGRWDGGEPVAYRWQTCEPGDPASCAAVTGLVGDTYVIGEADLGRALRVVEVAADAPLTVAPDGTVDLPSAAATAPSDLSPPVEAPPEASGVVPDVVGDTVSRAVAALSDAGFPTALVSTGDPVEDCDPVVSAQDPAADSEAAVGSVVTITAPPRGIECDLEDLPPLTPDEVS